MKLDYFNGKNVLVTGGAGAIGSILLKKLLEQDCKIIVLDNLDSGFESNISNVEFIKGSVSDEKTLNKVFENEIDIVFHLAANFANQNSVDNPLKDLETNGKGTLTLTISTTTFGMLLLISLAKDISLASLGFFSIKK